MQHEKSLNLPSPFTSHWCFWKWLGQTGVASPKTILLPVVVLSRDTYLSTEHLDHSVSQDELPRLVIAVWPRDDVQVGWLQVPSGSAGGSHRPSSNLVQNANISDQA
jgi:hypothetical protein